MKLSDGFRKLSFPSFHAKHPCVKITHIDFQPGDGKSLVVTRDLDFEKLMEYENSDTQQWLGDGGLKFGRENCRKITIEVFGI